MVYDRGSEPRRSPSGGRANYGGHRGGRTDHRSPEFRPQRNMNYHRRPYHNRSPEYDDGYRRRSRSRARYGHSIRAYRTDRGAPYRRSRSRSPWFRRSRSVDSNCRNERYLQRDAPSARFGSRASYLRSRDAHRGPSRSPSRVGRRQSPLVRDSAGRRPMSNRSDSRGRYRKRHDDFRERTKGHLSPERPLHRDRTPDRSELAFYKRRGARHPCSPDRHGAVCRSADRRGSDRSKRLRRSLSGSREGRALSASRRSPQRDRTSKRYRSGTRSDSGSRKTTAVKATRLSSDAESRVRQRPGTESRERKDANLNRCSPKPQATPLRRSSSGSRRRTPARSSQNRDRGARRRTSSHSRQGVDETPRRHSPYQDRSSRSARSVSRGRMAAESKHSKQPEQNSPRESSCRSADCPTPDLASSRSWKVDSEGADVSGRGVQQIASEEVTGAHIDATCSEEKNASGVAEALWCRQGRRSKTKHNGSVSRSPSLSPRDVEVEADEAKEPGPSRPTTPRAQEHVAPEKEHRRSTETAEPCAAPEVHGQEGSFQGDTPTQRRDETSPKGGEHAEKADSKGNRSSSMFRPHSRRPSEALAHGREGHTAGAASPEITAALDAMDLRRIEEPVNTYGRSTSTEDIAHSAEANGAAVKRRIVATEPGVPPGGTAEMYRAPRESPPRRYFRAQRLLPEQGDHVLSSTNRFPPNNANRWNRFEREERFDFPRPPHPGNTGRSVRLVGGYNDGSSLHPPQHRGRNMTSNEWQRMHLHNGAFQRAGQPNPRYLQRASAPFQPAGGRNRKMAGILGRGPPDRRHAAAASSADGKWGHDLFEQLSSEPERKRRRFNLYGETLEKVDD